MAWIENNVTSENALENCSMWALIMKRDFPELKIIKGSITHIFCNACYHEYLISPCGKIIDPTRIQFDILFGKDWSYNK